MTKKIAAYDDDGIWGVGDNEAQARAEAEGFLRETAGDDDEAYASMLEALKVGPISDDLLNRAAPDEGTLSGKVTINYSDYPYLVNEEGVLVFDADKAAADDDAGVSEFIEGESDDEPSPASLIDDIADGVAPTPEPVDSPEPPQVDTGPDGA